MKIYCELIRQLDSTGANYSQALSEVDLSDPEDAKVTVNDPSGEVLVHLGGANYLDRFRIYVSHVAEWRQEFQKLDSVDLRYDRQIIVNPDSRTAAEKPLSGTAVRAAIAAGVKPTAFTSSDLKRAAKKTVEVRRKSPAASRRGVRHHRRKRRTATSAKG